MKTIAEVKELLGIGRRTLQEYDAKDLVHPSNIEEIKNGKLVKWLYDDDAIRRLEIISIFREIGYTRKEIKGILDDPKRDLSEEFEIGKKKLLEKKERIDEMIAVIDYFTLINNIPDSFFAYLNSVSSESTHKRLNANSMLDFGKVLNSELGMITDDNSYTLEFVLLVFYTVTLKEHSPYSVEVQQYIEMVIKRYFERFIEQNEEVPEKIRDSIVMSLMNNADAINAAFKFIDDFSKDESSCEHVDTEFGKGSSKFLMEAVAFYKKGKGGSEQ